MSKKQKRSRVKIMDMSANLNLAFTYKGVEFKRSIEIIRVDPNNRSERRELEGVFSKTIDKLLKWAKLSESYRAALKKLQGNQDVIKKGVK